MKKACRFRERLCREAGRFDACDDMNLECDERIRIDRLKHEPCHAMLASKQEGESCVCDLPLVCRALVRPRVLCAFGSHCRLRDLDAVQKALFVRDRPSLTESFPLLKEAIGSLS